MADRARSLRTIGAKAPCPASLCLLTDPVLRPFVESLGAWLERHQAAAVLVRPDRCIFGTGAPAELVQRFTAAMTD
jgi:hypothetical protein